MRGALSQSIALALLGSCTLIGCASLPMLGGKSGAEAARAQRILRPEAPPEYDVLVAQEFEVAGRTEDALAAYERALGKDPESPFLHRKVAETLARQGRLDEAALHATRAFEADPENVATRHFLGQLHRLSRDVEAADRVLRDASGEPIDERAGLSRILRRAQDEGIYKTCHLPYS